MNKFVMIMAATTVLAVPMLAASMLAGPVFAQETGHEIKLEKGETLLSLSATEQMRLKQDLLQASLRIEADSKDSKKLQNDINTKMKSALDLARGVDGVKTSTGQYNVYSYDPNPQPPQQTQDLKALMARQFWKGSQSIELETKDQSKLLDLAGKIQEMGFVMNSLNYVLSPEQSEAYRDNLMVAALKKIQAKADLAAKALGKSGYTISEVTVDNAGPFQPMPVMYKAARMEMAGDAMAAPVAQSGEQMVSLTVTARVILKP